MVKTDDRPFTAQNLPLAAIATLARFWVDFKGQQEYINSQQGGRKKLKRLENRISQKT